jgi:hypothetical protein
MADYDFRSLSSHDCALLARGLLQAKLNLALESFSSGPDSGIGFRYQHESTNLILQSKYYANSGYATLASLLRRKERQKIDALAPTGYIRATSVSLIPNRKDGLITCRLESKSRVRPILRLQPELSLWPGGADGTPDPGMAVSVADCWHRSKLNCIASVSMSS